MMTIRSSWRPAADRVELFKLLAGGNDGDAAAGVLNQGGDLLAGQGGIDGHIGGADGQGGEVAHRPLPAVFADEGDAVAFLRAPARAGLCRERGRAGTSGRTRWAASGRVRPATGSARGLPAAATWQKRSLMVAIEEIGVIDLIRAQKTSVRPIKGEFNSAGFGCACPVV